MAVKRQIKLFVSKILSATSILDFLWDKEPSWRILMYHRVINPESLSYPVQAGMYVRPETFEMHCKFLKQNANVIFVEELIQKVLDGEALPKKTVAITFDDGWKDNLDNAFPILKTLNLPATIFLPTNFISTNKLFWTDQVARVLRLTSKASDKLAIPPSSQLEEQLETFLGAFFTLAPVSREAAVRELIKNLPPNQQREFLNWEEVSKLDLFGVKVGSHSHNHKLFEELSKKERINELKTSRDMLKHKSLLTSRVFVFPGGSHTLEMGKECVDAGYLAALTTSRNSNPKDFLFPRVGIHEDISYTESFA